MRMDDLSGSTQVPVDGGPPNRAAYFGSSSTQASTTNADHVLIE